MFWERSKPTTHGKRTNGKYQNGNEELIHVKQVVKNFDTAVGKFTVLKSVALRVDGGKFGEAIAKSGSGKSTLIIMIAGIDQSTSGEASIGETAVH